MTLTLKYIQPAACKHTSSHMLSEWVWSLLIIFTLSAALGPVQLFRGLRTSLLVKVYLGSGICLYPLKIPWLTSLFTRVRTLRISSASELQEK